jgi:hypothetical protein
MTLSLTGTREHSRVPSFVRDLPITQYKISKIKLSISMIAVTPAIESSKACLASW